MKTLKFEHTLADLVRSGQKTSTWRMYDDKNIAVNDRVELIDKVNKADPDSWLAIGTAVVDKVIEKRLRDVIDQDYEGERQFKSIDDLLTTYKKYYGSDVTADTPVKIVYFTLQKNNKNQDPKSSTASEQFLEEVK